MARVRLTFRQRDITAAIKGVEAAGLTVARVKIGQDGEIVVEVAPPATSNQQPEEPPRNPWDELLDENHPPVQVR
jgi:hypothetical protein